MTTIHFVGLEGKRSITTFDHKAEECKNALLSLGYVITKIESF